MGAHQPHLGLGVPDQDASQESSLPLGQLAEINTNIPPLISPYTFKLFNLDLTLYFLFTCFALGPCLIMDQCVGRASS